MARALLFLFLLFLAPPLFAGGGVWGGVARAQNQDAVALQLGGFPLLDPDGLLDAGARQTLEARQAALKDCCDLDLVLLVQEGSLSGTLANDLSLLRAQMRRADLWTPQTLLLMLQTRPPGAVGARGPSVRAQTVEASALRALGDDPAGVGALPAFLAELENATKAAIRAEQAPLISPPQARLLRQLAWTLATFGAALVLLIGHRRQSGLSQAQRLIELLPAQPLTTFAFPKATLRAHEGALHSARARVVWMGQGVRHRGLALTLAALVALSVQWGTEGGGIKGGAVDGGVLDSLLPSGLALRALSDLPASVLGLALGGGSLLVLLLTPLGVWLTPPPWRRQGMRVGLVRQALRHPEAFVFLAYQRGRLSVWQPTTAALRADLLRTPAQRLAEETSHGLAASGMEGFIVQLDRLGRTYLQNRI